MRHRRDVYLAMLTAVLGGLCQTGVPLIERQIVDNVILTPGAALWPWLTLLILVAVASFGFAYIRRYRGGRVALSVQNDLRNDMHDHLQTMDFANLDRMPTGQLVSRANSDTALVQGLLAFLPIMSGNVLLMLLSIGVMLYLSPLLAVVSLLVAPALLVVSYRMRWRIFPATWDGQQREGDVAQIVDEDVNGVRVVKAFGQEQRELERMAGVASDLYGSQMRAVRLQSRYQPLLQAIPALGQVAVLALGGWLTLQGDITLGTFLAFSTYIGQLMAPARQLAGILTVGQQARAGVERIFELLGLKPAIADKPAAVELSDIRGEIDFAGVDFHYRAAAADETHPPATLKSLNLHINAGERVAIVGPSGSGKSTVTALVSRFYDPSAGVVRVDGHDLRDVTLQSLRRQVGVVFEESFLFSDSVRSNIAYGRPEATDEEVFAAARAAEADEFIRRLPRGYNTVVGERGLTLSGGQRQRIALARALLANPRILILDDATSAVDSRTEESIHHALREVMADRTTLLVAHRRSTLHLADRIVVLEAGAVVEEGTHEELFASSPGYRRLLTGLDEEVAAQIGDRVEALVDFTRGLDEPSSVTAAAWSGGRPAAGASYNGRSIGAPSIGAGLGGGGRGASGSWRMNLAPTPELLARVAALQPIRDEAVVELQQEARHERRFSLRRLLREFRRPLMVGLALVVLDGVASLAGPVLVKIGIDSGVAAGSSRVLFAAAAAFLLITLSDLLVEIAETFVTGRTAQRVMLSLRIRIWAHLQRLSLDYYEREMAGRIMTRMTTDVDQFESLIQNGLLSALVSLVTFVGVGVVLLLVNVELALCTLSVIVPLAIATYVFRRKSSRLYDISRERVAIVNADFQESLSGVRESQAFVHEARTKDRFHRLGLDYLTSRIAAQRLVATYFPFVQFLSAVADAIVLGVGAGLISQGHLTTGALIAFILYVDMFFSPIQQLSQVFDSWQQTRVSVNRIAELMQLETLTPQPAEPVDPGRLRGEISLENVRFSYPLAPHRVTAGPVSGPADPRLLEVADAAGGKPPEALHRIDITIAAGETVALVGETGAGKSTVMKLLARFYDPDAGAVRIDGHDLRTLDLGAFRRQLGYVPQEAFLFTGSVRDNIAYGRPDATEAEVEAAARAVGAHDFIAGLTGGYLHEISERGRSMSAGQRQLLALARAELVDPLVLLLDEATSNLDLATEARVSAAMSQLARGRTSIVIAHRMQTARQADRIVVLSHGGVAEVGSHEQLLAADGQYAAMWRAFETIAGGEAVAS
ncbi:ATP-binding cassette, subfamily B [Frankineae bacterium MT45]|nr:ATP-binding cassette, subfamily B [Frankineae bacterium MT45]